MKMKCTEGSDFGKFFSADFEIPSQEEIDNGKLPYFSVAVDGDFVEDEQGRTVKDEEGNFVIKDSLLDVLWDAGVASEDTAGIVEIDALQLFSQAAYDAESSEIVAGWLEYMACQIRSKFDKKP